MPDQQPAQAFQTRAKVIILRENLQKHHFFGFNPRKNPIFLRGCAGCWSGVLDIMDNPPEESHASPKIILATDLKLQQLCEKKMSMKDGRKLNCILNESDMIIPHHIAK